MKGMADAAVMMLGFRSSGTEGDMAAALLSVAMMICCAVSDETLGSGGCRIYAEAGELAGSMVNGLSGRGEAAEKQARVMIKCGPFKVMT